MAQGNIGVSSSSGHVVLEKIVEEIKKKD